MTLTEYINQVDPIKMPSVELQMGEFEMGVFISQTNRQQVHIPAINKYLGKNAEYCTLDGGRTLWSCDENGNPHQFSCFHLPQCVISNGYSITHNSIFGNWDVAHPEIGHCGYYSSLKLAIEDCVKG